MLSKEAEVPTNPTFQNLVDAINTISPTEKLLIFIASTVNPKYQDFNLSLTPAENVELTMSIQGLKLYKVKTYGTFSYSATSEGFEPVSGTVDFGSEDEKKFVNLNMQSRINYYKAATDESYGYYQKITSNDLDGFNNCKWPFTKGNFIYFTGGTGSTQKILTFDKTTKTITQRFSQYIGTQGTRPIGMFNFGGGDKYIFWDGKTFSNTENDCVTVDMSTWTFTTRRTGVMNVWLEMAFNKYETGATYGRGYASDEPNQSPIWRLDRADWSTLTKTIVIANLPTNSVPPTSCETAYHKDGLLYFYYVQYRNVGSNYFSALRTFDFNTNTFGVKKEWNMYLPYVGTSTLYYDDFEDLLIHYGFSSYAQQNAILFNIFPFFARNILVDVFYGFIRDINGNREDTLSVCGNGCVSSYVQPHFVFSDAENIYGFWGAEKEIRVIRKAQFFPY